MRRRSLSALAGAAALLAVAVSGCGVLGVGEKQADIQVYSARHYDLENAFKEFTDQTGITVDFLYGDDAELLQRLKAEGRSTPADVYMTVDAGNLWNAAHEDVLAPLESPTLDAAVPADLRDPQDRWFGLALRARTVAYNPDAVDPSELDPENTYAGLTDPRWKGRLCMRDETEAYTQSLVASLIDLYGRDKTLEIVKGWVANDVQIMSNDILLLQALDSGACDVALVNHYYYARELTDNPELNVKLYWASQQGAGTHVNISGAGVVKASDNPKQAQQLVEWLGTKGQSDFVDGNHEYPVNLEVKPEPLIAKFGTFKRMALDPEAYGKLNAEATDLLAEAGYK